MRIASCLRADSPYMTPEALHQRMMKVLKSSKLFLRIGPCTVISPFHLLEAVDASNSYSLWTDDVEQNDAQATDPL